MNPVDAKYLIDAIENGNYKFNEWERKFIKSIKRKCIGWGRFLTVKQSDMLQKIYRKSQGGQ